MRDRDLTRSVALGIALGGSVVCFLNYAINRGFEVREVRRQEDAEHMDWQLDVPADLAGGLELTRSERATLGDIEWAEGPSMDPRLEDVETDVYLHEEGGSGEESSSSS